MQAAKDTDVRIDHEWHSLSPDVVAQALASSQRKGLDNTEALSRLQSEGPNRLPVGKRRPPWLRFLLQFHNPLIYVLIVAGLTTLALGGHVDAAVIFGVVVINAMIGHIQEGKAERALEAVRDMLA